MKKILIIDDDEQLRGNVAEILSLSGYDAIHAPEGRTGIERALKEKPNLILCDVMMPIVDGYGVLHILSRHPETSSIPFIFLTGKNEITDLRQGMGMGADDYLVKPFDETDLLNSIEIRLKKHEGRRFKSQDRVGISEIFKPSPRFDGFDLNSSKRDIYKHRKKHVLYSIDQKPLGVYFVISGKLKEYLFNEDGKELITNIYSKGDFLGYIAVLEDIHYTENMQVIEDAQLLLISRADFLQLIDTDPQVARRFINLLCQNIREKEEKLINLAYNSLRRKVASAIIEVVDKFRDKKEGKPVLEISREDLAHVIGSAPESMIRTLKEFKTENLIEVSEGYIVVLNEEKLRHLVH